MYSIEHHHHHLFDWTAGWICSRDGYIFYSHKIDKWFSDNLLFAIQKIFDNNTVPSRARIRMIVPPIHTKYNSQYSIIEWTHYLNMELNRTCIGWKLARVQTLHTIFYVCVSNTFTVSNSNCIMWLFTFAVQRSCYTAEHVRRKRKQELLSTVANWNEQRNEHVSRIKENDTKRASLTNEKNILQPIWIQSKRMVITLGA